jgi:hypothetical protein
MSIVAGVAESTITSLIVDNFTVISLTSIFGEMVTTTVGAEAQLPISYDYSGAERFLDLKDPAVWVRRESVLLT